MDRSYDLCRAIEEVVEECKKTGSPSKVQRLDDKGRISLWLEADWVNHPDELGDVIEVYFCYTDTGRVAYSQFINETRTTFKKHVPSDILIWNKNVGFIQIFEGDGSNLLEEDQKEGYVDYMMVNFMSYDGTTVDVDETRDNPQVMLEELYQDKFNTAEDVIDHLITHDWIPDQEYVILCAN